jgi:hypothetical protein
MCINKYFYLLITFFKMERSEFQVTLKSNAKGYGNNTPVNFTNHLARPLNLPGSWSVALIDLSYPHQWTNVVEDLEYAILVPTKETPRNNRNSYVADFEDIQPKPNSDELLNDLIIPVDDFSKSSMLGRDLSCLNLKPNCRWLYHIEKVQSGEYQDAEEICLKFGRKFRKFLRTQIDDLPDRPDLYNSYYNSRRRKTLIRSPDTKTAIVARKRASIIHLMGHSRNAKLIRLGDNNELELLYIPREVSFLEGPDPIDLRPITNMFVYSDIVNDSLVGETQESLMGYMPLVTTHGQQGYWCFNPPYYPKVGLD